MSWINFSVRVFMIFMININRKTAEIKYALYKCACVRACVHA